jgi:hypothetical protein
MMLALNFKVSGVSLLRGVEGTDINPFAVNLDLGHEPVMVRRDTYQAQAVVVRRADAVLEVDRMRHVTQVAKPVVRRVAVDVVNVAKRPEPMNVQPYKAVRSDVLAINAKQDSAVWLSAASDRASKASANAKSARKNARIRVVVQKGAETIRCQFVH